MDSPPGFSLDNLACHKRRLLEYDLLQAARIQQALLPRPMSGFAGYEIGYHYAPADLISGDYCDLIECKNGLLFLFGDVCGKGVAAALLMSHLHGVFRSLANTSVSLNSMVATANRLFVQSMLPGHFVTLVVGRANHNGLVEFISAGHPPSLHLREGIATHKLATAHPFGMFEESRFPVHHFYLDLEDTLLMYSDGMTEHRNPAGQEYGFGRLSCTAAKHHAAALPDLIAGCLADLSSFAIAAEQTDDLSLLAIRRTA